MSVVVCVCLRHPAPQGARLLVKVEGLSLALRSHDQIQASHWSTPPTPGFFQGFPGVFPGFSQGFPGVFPRFFGESWFLPYAGFLSSWSLIPSINNWTISLSCQLFCLWLIPMASFIRNWFWLRFFFLCCVKIVIQFPNPSLFQDLQENSPLQGLSNPLPCPSQSGAITFPRQKRSLFHDLQKHCLL